MARNKIFIVAVLLGAIAWGWAADSSKSKSNWLKKIGNTMPDSKESANVAGVRGLEDSDQKIVGSEARDYAAMDELESIQISDDDLRQFASEGGLK